MCPHNNIECPCPKDCPRHGKCCACVAHHREKGDKLPVCLRGIEWEEQPIIDASIRDEQKKQLLVQLQQPGFIDLMRSSNFKAPISCCSPSGRWHLTQDDLDEILKADGRGIKGRIVQNVQDRVELFF